MDERHTSSHTMAYPRSSQFSSTPAMRSHSTARQVFGDPATPDKSHSSLFSASRNKNMPGRIDTNVQYTTTNRAPQSFPSDAEQRNGDSNTSTPLVNPTSALLQGLINEQRANRAGARKAQPDQAPEVQVNTPTGTQSQDDSSSERQRKINIALSAGLKQPHEMGVREMDKYVSKINKLNFDLKLDLFHRTQQIASLEKKVERMQALEEQLQSMEGLEEELQELREVEENNQRLRESNEELRLELDKRDQAVNEAVELICQLEAKLESLGALEEERPSTARPHTSEGLIASPGSSPKELTPKSCLIPDVPDRTSSRKATRSAMSLRSQAETPGSSRRPKRQPSFLRSSNGSTSALRSLYVDDGNKTRSGFSTLSRADSVLSGDDIPEPESPRLSVLSECSYLNTSNNSPSKRPQTHEPVVTSRARNFTEQLSSKWPVHENGEKNGKVSRIDQWIQPQVFVPESPAPRNLRLDTSRTSPRRVPSLGAAFQDKPTAKTYRLDSPSIDGPIFNGGRLPPTPDTMSTGHEVRDGSNPSIIAEKSRRDHGKYYTSFLAQTSLERRRSADDITTRPNTADTALSEALSDETQLGGLHMEDRKNHLTSMFPSFAFTTRRAPESANFPETNVESDMRTPVKNKKSVGSELQPNHRRNSSSPPLTPQDWLEAALAADTADDSKVDGNCRNPRDHDTPEPEEPELPPPSTFRLRVERGKASPANSQIPPRRRLSLRPRFFSRSMTTSQQQVPLSDPVDRDGFPSSIRKARNVTAAGRQSMNTGVPARRPSARGRTPVNDQVSTQNEGKQTAPPPPQVATARPGTSDGLEKRRSGLGLFSWMKGGNASGPSARDVTDPSSFPTDEDIQPPAERETASILTGPPKKCSNQRSSNSVKIPLGDDVSVSVPDPSFASAPDEQSDRRSIFPHRRQRRG